MDVHPRARTVLIASQGARTSLVPRAWLHAHRGASADAPENTLASFRLGLAQRADGIELDLHATADGVAVVLHDDALDRTTDRAGALAELLVRDVVEADTRGRWIGESAARAAAAAGWPPADSHVPTLAEVLDWLPGDRGLVIDVKAVDAVAPMVELLDARRRSAPGTTRVISFLPSVIAQVRALAPWLETGLLLDELEDLDDGIARARAAGHRSVVPWAPDLGTDDALAANAATVHDAGLELGCYTVNDPTRALELRAAGIDFLMSDVPGLVADAMDALPSPS